MTASHDAERATRRFFFALWPAAPVQAALAARASEVQRVAGGRAMRADSMHLTLAFVGDVPADTLPALEAAGSAATFAPFDFTLDAIGWFAAKRLGWAGAQAIPGPLDILASSLRVALRDASVRVDPQPFVAHVTLVRNAERLVAPPAGTPAMQPVVWPVRDFALVESVPAGGHRAYRVVARWPGR